MGPIRSPGWGGQTPEAGSPACVSFGHLLPPPPPAPPASVPPPPAPVYPRLAPPRSCWGPSASLLGSLPVRGLVLSYSLCPPSHRHDARQFSGRAMVGVAHARVTRTTCKVHSNKPVRRRGLCLRVPPPPPRPVAPVPSLYCSRRPRLPSRWPRWRPWLFSWWWHALCSPRFRPVCLLWACSVRCCRARSTLPGFGPWASGARCFVRPSRLSIPLLHLGFRLASLVPLSLLTRRCASWGGGAGGGGGTSGCWSLHTILFSSFGACTMRA